MSNSEGGDLTGILDYAKKLKESEASQTKAVSADSTDGLPEGVEDRPIEKIEHFESLDELPQAPEVADPFAAPALDTPATESAFAISEPPGIPEALPEWNAGEPEFEPAVREEPSSFSPEPEAEKTEPASEPVFTLSPPPSELPTHSSPQSFTSEPAFTAPPISNEPHLAHRSITFPHHLVIRGVLAENEKERLFELIRTYEIGVSESELKIQFESARLLLPEVSEYFSVLVAGALRDSSAELTVIPSALWNGFAFHFPEVPSSDRSTSSKSQNENFTELNPVFSGDLTSLIESDSPEIPVEEITLVASARIPNQDLNALNENERARELDSLIERLIDQVRHKAKFKKAQRTGEIKTEFQSPIAGEPERILVSLQAWIPVHSLDR